MDAITATGATRLQVLRFGVLPQVLPLFLSYVLYRLETNIRAATVLGFVGAGGIGFYLQTYLRMIDYPAASTVLLVTVAMVMVVDAAQLPPPREARLAASTSNRRPHRDGREVTLRLAARRGRVAERGRRSVGSPAPSLATRTSLGRPARRVPRRSMEPSHAGSNPVSRLVVPRAPHGHPPAPSQLRSCTRSHAAPRAS